MPGFLEDTADIRAGDWRIAPVPADLQDRRVEITGPVDRKMIINALNSPVKCFMADFEDSCSPTWENVLLGQVNLRDAIDRIISYTNPANGKRYELNDETATLSVRPRGWHLTEKHCLIDGERASASIFDFALYLANNHESLKANGDGGQFRLVPTSGSVCVSVMLQADPDRFPALCSSPQLSVFLQKLTCCSV